MSLHSLKPHFLLFLLLTFFGAIRLYIAPLTGLGVDEAHYALYGELLDWSYFDHPPLVGWVEHIFTHYFGNNEFAVRVPAIIIGFITSLLLYIFLYSITKNWNIALLGVVALHASFIFNALFLMFLPDTLLFLLLIPTIYATLYVVQKQTTLSWIILGFLLGIAGLSKYTAILFVVPIVLFVILKKEFKLFINPKIILTIVIALACISPVIYWNIQHDWISFTYQSNHVVGNPEINFKSFARSLAAQFGAYNPFLMPLAFYGLYKALRSKKDTLFLSGLFGLVLFGFFSYASLYKTALPHWSALFYMLFIPIGVVFLYENAKKYITFSLLFGIGISLILYAELAFKFIPQPDFQSLHRDLYGWNTIMEKAKKVAKDKPICVTNWTLASRAMFYAKENKKQIYLLDNRFDQFDLWNDATKLQGKDIIVINTHEFHKQLKSYIKCDSLEQKAKVELKLHNHFVNEVEFVECKNYQGLLNE